MTLCASTLPLRRASQKSVPSDGERDDADADDAGGVAREDLDALVRERAHRAGRGQGESHATTMLRTTLQCTTPPALPRPAPMMPPETTCVVESEKPK